MPVSEDIFGIATNPFTKKAQIVRRYTMTNDLNTCISVLTYGAIIQRVITEDNKYQLADICLGFDDVHGYLQNEQYHFGCVLGRVAGPIVNAEYTIKKKKTFLTPNLYGKHHMNGGNIGFDKVIWDLCQLRNDGVTLMHTSPHGHEGYPGNLKVFLHYTLDDHNRLNIGIEARTDRTTPVNIANHVFFNLAGHNAGRAALEAHRVSSVAKYYVDTDDKFFPTGHFKRTINTLYDWRLPVFMSDRLRQMTKHPKLGYDFCYALYTDYLIHKVKHAARFLHMDSGRYMDVLTNQPALHITTANDFPNFELQEVPIWAKDCGRYYQHSAFSVQAQMFPDSANLPEFPTIMLMPNEKYYHETTYRFGAKKSWEACATPDEVEQMYANPSLKDYL